MNTFVDGRILPLEYDGRRPKIMKELERDILPIALAQMDYGSLAASYTTSTI